MLFGLAAAKPRVGGQCGPIDGEGTAGQRTGAEGQHIDALQQIGQTFAIALPGPRVAQQPVAPAHGLRGLDVGVAGHQDVDLGLGAVGGGAVRSASGVE